jgi:hypothetical protein
MTPLNEPFYSQQKAPVLHRCMRANPPTRYIKKFFGDPILDNCNSSKELMDFLKKIHWTHLSSLVAQGDKTRNDSRMDT